MTYVAFNPSIGTGPARVLVWCDVPRRRLHACPRGDVGVGDADGRRHFVLVAVQERIAVGEAESADGQIGKQWVARLKDDVAKYDGIGHRGLARAIQGKIIE